MTHIEIPRNVSRGARAIYAFAVLLADETGEVPGGQGRLREYAGHDSRRYMIMAMDELEAARLIKRVGRTSRQRVFVLDLALRGSQANLCERCGVRPKSRLQGAKVCPGCLQSIDRRWWKAMAVEVWAQGVRAGHSDWKIAYAIHAVTKQPLWGRSEDGQQGSGSGDGEGVVAAMVSLGLFPEEMMAVAKAAKRGGEPDDV